MKGDWSLGMDGMGGGKGGRGRPEGVDSELVKFALLWFVV